MCLLRIKVRYLRMTEDITSFVHDSGAQPFYLQMAGISYCDGAYRIERALSDVTVMEYILSGQGDVWVEDQNFTATAGDFYVLPQGSRHRFQSAGRNPWVKIWFNARGPLMDALVQTYRLQGVYHVKGAPPELEPLFRALVEDARSHRADAAAAFAQAALDAHAVVQGVILHLYGGGAPDEAQPLRRYLDSHVGLEVSLSALSLLIHRSPSQTIRIFHRAFHTTPYDYLMHKRVETARLLLQNTNLSVREIAMKLQFSDEHYFSNYFKKKTGMSPTRFRRGSFR